MIHDSSKHSDSKINLLMHTVGLQLKWQKITHFFKITRNVPRMPQFIKTHEVYLLINLIIDRTWRPSTTAVGLLIKYQ
jgi:hypothetical protein